MTDRKKIRSLLTKEGKRKVAAVRGMTKARNARSKAKAKVRNSVKSIKASGQPAKLAKVRAEETIRKDAADKAKKAAHKKAVQSYIKSIPVSEGRSGSRGSGGMPKPRRPKL